MSARLHPRRVFGCAGLVSNVAYTKAMLRAALSG
jgi:hypothetical protein